MTLKLNRYRVPTMNNLTELREQLQEDMIAYFDGYDFGLNIDEICQIIVDRVTELQDNLEEKDEKTS